MGMTMKMTSSKLTKACLAFLVIGTVATGFDEQEWDQCPHRIVRRKTVNPPEPIRALVWQDNAYHWIQGTNSKFAMCSDQETLDLEIGYFLVKFDGANQQRNGWFSSGNVAPPARN